MKFTVEIELNEPQVASMQELAFIEPQWRWANLIVRMDGQEIPFEADWVRDVCRGFRKATGMQSNFQRVMESKVKR